MRGIAQHPTSLEGKYLPVADAGALARVVDFNAFVVVFNERCEPSSDHCGASLRIVTDCRGVFLEKICE